MGQIKKLPKEFIGRGEVKGFQFKQIYEHDKFYIYRVTINGETPVVHYEIIRKRLYKDTEVYPMAKSFGIHGWTQLTIEGVIKSAKEHFKVDIEKSGLDL